MEALSTVFLKIFSKNLFSVLNMVHVVNYNGTKNKEPSWMEQSADLNMDDV